MKEKLLRKPVIISAAAVLLVAVVIGVVAAVGGFRQDDGQEPVASDDAVQTADTAAQPETEKKSDGEKNDTKNTASPQQEQKLTAKGLLEEMNGKLSKADYISGNTQFEILPVDAKTDDKTAADSADYMFESSRTTPVVHTSGVVNKSGESEGTEAYILQSKGKVKLLSCRNGTWSSTDNVSEGVTFKSIDDFIALANIPDYDLEPDTADKDGQQVYVLKAQLKEKEFAGFLKAAGVSDEFDTKSVTKGSSAEATLLLNKDTKLPVSLSVSSQAGKNTGGLNYCMSFSGFDREAPINVPEADIEKAIKLANEAPKTDEAKKADTLEEGKKTDSTSNDSKKTDTPASTYHSDVWVDVDLTNQCITLYSDGKAIMSSPCVTGNVTNGWATPTGTYSVSYTTTSAYLMGDAYVDYWMPFNGGIGFHDASWRYGNFGSTEAWSNGSHGCVNLPHGAAETLYQYLSAGDTVVVHGWPQDPANVHTHTAGAWKITKEATCVSAGKRVRYCTDCGELVEEETIAKTGKHTAGGWVVTKEATESSTGKREQRCKVCNTVIKTETIPKLAHTHVPNGNWEIVSAPTCTASGQRVQRCAADNEIVLTETIPATGHSWGDWTTTIESTCTASGERSRTCSACGETESETIPATGHGWGDWITTAEPTCGADGQRTRTCALCGDSETETIPATGEHSWGEPDEGGVRHCGICGAEG
ncbi:MAG: L,D-transpeptidase [Oscillospiraceae bacterium]|nr:L,D-transpeptidase [Oscillospiraceae bacterium]